MKILDHNRVRPRRHFSLILDTNFRGRPKAMREEIDWIEHIENVTRSIYEILPIGDERPPFDRLDKTTKKRWYVAAEKIWDICRHD